MKKIVRLSFVIGVALIATGCSSQEKKVCTQNAGTWVSDHQECEYIPQDVCETAGGNFQECASACRHTEAKDGEPMTCTMQCVQVCAFENATTNNEDNKNTLIEEETNNLKLKVKYPVTGISSFDMLVKEFIMKRVNDFKEKIGEERISKNWKNLFYITFEPFTYSENIRTYKFDIMEFTGGAHDNLYFKTFTFDFENEKEIGFRDMFQEEHNPLNTIAPLAKEQLTTTLGENSMLKMGTSEKFENYEHFAPTADKLLIFFPPYQVAPWAAGPQKVQFSWEDINVVLKPPFFFGN